MGGAISYHGYSVTNRKISGITMGSHVSDFAIPRGLSIEDPDGTRRVVFTLCAANIVANLILLQNLRLRGH